MYGTLNKLDKITCPKVRRVTRSSGLQSELSSNQFQIEIAVSVNIVEFFKNILALT